MHFVPVANDYWKGSFWFMSESYSWIACQGHPSVNVIDHGHCTAHVCICVHICVFLHMPSPSHTHPNIVSTRGNASYIWINIGFLRCLQDDRQQITWQYDKHRNTKPLHHNRQKKFIGMAANTFWIMFPTWSKHKRAFNLFWCFTVDTNMRFDWRHFQPRLCNHKHMTAPKNAILPGQNWGFCPFLVQTFRQNQHLTSSNLGCFESLIFHRIFPTQDRFFFFCPPPFHFLFWRWFFPVSTTFSSPDVCPTFRARRARRLPDVFPTFAC